MRIPFVDLKSQYQSIKTEIDRAIQNVLSDASFIGGKEVREFEENFASYLGIKHCIGCANGTDAIELLLQAFGIGPGDEVLVPAHTWISTAEAVSNTGAIPVFADTNPSTYTINPSIARKKVTSRTKAVIPVHLFGQPADMSEIMDIASSHSLVVIEDCAQSHGAVYRGKKTGTIGHAATFSFYPGKNLGAYGDAGAVVTPNDEIAEKVRLITNHGQKTKHQHIIKGRNSRLDSLQAAVLTVKLKYLDKWNKARIENANYYNSLLADVPVTKPVTAPGRNHVFHLYVIASGNRDRIVGKLEQHHIQTGIHYPAPLPLTKAYSHFNLSENDFPVSSSSCKKIISLPMFAELDKKQIEYTCSCIADCLAL